MPHQVFVARVARVGTFDLRANLDDCTCPIEYRLVGRDWRPTVFRASSEDQLTRIAEIIAARVFRWLPGYRAAVTVRRVLPPPIRSASGTLPPRRRRRSPVPQLAFLTRKGCVNTTTMRANIDAALQRLGWRADYQAVDVDALPAADPRHGYGTPTVLVNDRDLFGMAEPTTPPPPAG